MKLIIKVFFFILLFTMSKVSAYDVNSTLVEGNVTVYQNLLKSIKEDKNGTSEKELEVSLLHMLIADANKRLKSTNIDVSTPTNSDTYKMLFNQYLNDLIHLSKIQKLLSQNKNKISTIENEIQKLDKNSTKALSFELQDALYHKNILLYQKQNDMYQKQIKKIEKTFINTLNYIQIHIITVKSEISKNKVEEEKIINKMNSLEIDKEQAELIENTKKISILDRAIEKLKAEEQILVQNMVTSQFLLFSAALQKKDQLAFSLGKQLLNDLEGLNNISSDNRDRVSLLLHAMENKYLGALQTFTGSGKEEIKTLWYQIWDFISTPIFTINQTPISIFKLIMTLFIFIMGFIFGALYKRKIKNMTLNRRSFTTSTRTLLANLGYYFIIVIAFFISLNVLGIKFSSLAVIAGALSVGIGFGLQNIVSNFVSGLILMIERSIKIGDYIQIDDDLRGYVSDIRMRSTTVVTNENIDVIIPNQKLIENNVINWTMSDSIRRFSIPFGVAYGTDVHKVIDLVTQAVLQSEFREDIVESKQHATSVIMTEMGDSSVNFELFVWVKGDDLHKPKRTASTFLILIYDTLNKNNIEIPFPQQDLHIRSIEDTFVIKQIDGKNEV